MLNTRGGGVQHGILFIFIQFDEYNNIGYVIVHIHVIYRANKAEYGIRILVAASQEYVNLYSIRKLTFKCMPLFCSTESVEAYAYK